MKRGLRVLPTRDGLVFVGLLACLAAVALAIGNNLLVILVALLGALGIVGVGLSMLNLRGLHAARSLPPELFAASDARGCFVLRNPRRWLPAVLVQIEDVGTGARTIVPVLGPGQEVVARAVWCFDERGTATLSRLRLASTFPFGLTVQSLELPMPAELLVYPKPRNTAFEPEQGHAGSHRSRAAQPGRLGDFEGLREYRAGDAPRSIHWPTTARVGAPMVVQRSGEAGQRVIVRVGQQRGEAFEKELRRACGEVLRAFARGCEVGLELPRDRMEPRGGSAWRRHLLDALALAEPS